MIRCGHCNGVHHFSAGVRFCAEKMGAFDDPSNATKAAEEDEIRDRELAEHYQGLLGGTL